MLNSISAGTGTLLPILALLGLAVLIVVLIAVLGNKIGGKDRNFLVAGQYWGLALGLSIRFAAPKVAGLNAGKGGRS